ncbi:MAG TPA: hypothetical protein VMT88_09310, partial [Actinomycetes bacterium]|nr:hypothetical protein [Actinomycetes bacterium]
TNSTFACSLDGGTAQPCSSPTSYSGLALGTHQFSVAATDASGNTDTTPAIVSWSVVDQLPPLFADDFSSGSFTAGGWVVKTAGTGTATVEDGAVTSSNLGARLVSPKGDSTAFAYIRKTFTAQTSLDLTWSTKVTVQSGSTQQVGILRFYDSAGTRVLKLSRESGSNALILNVAGSDFTTTGTLPLNTVRAMRVHVAPTTGGWSVRVDVNNSIVYDAVVNSMGNGSLNRIEIGDNSTSRVIDYRVDDVAVRS